MKMITAALLKQFFKQTISIGLVMGIIVFALLRLTFRDFPFSPAEDVLLFLKIVAAACTVAVTVGAAVYSFIFISEKIQLLLMGIRVKRFRLPEIISGDFVTAEA